ncbi:tigger transposable element-derived protein 1-like [Palaemon carinicauda]|uniref:tigger transposable element-derived protein 1-like n=1 Tax=Palaemon carinicauda TaxID=392227 RepID=UPI0035B68094
MGPKSKDKDGDKKMISMEIKHERGVRICDLAAEYGHNTSTISTILKQKDTIKKVQISKGLTIMPKLHSDLHEMERLLLIWIKEKELAGDSVTETIISEKAVAIVNDLIKQDAAEEGGESLQGTGDEFKASRGWFENFKKRTGIHLVVRHGEAASADVKAAEEFIQRFNSIVAQEAYIPQQVFNCDTGLFLKKKMPKRTYITAEEKKLPGHKLM